MDVVAFALGHLVLNVVVEGVAICIELFLLDEDRKIHSGHRLHQSLVGEH